MPPPSVEHEATLFIASDDPDDVARRIAGLPTIAGFHLLPQDPLVIRDIHFDSPDGALHARGLALRIRWTRRQTLVTLKGPSQALPGGALARTEIERPWSSEALRAVLDALEAMEIRLPEPRQARGGSPRKAMRSLGLEEIQDRETRRVPRSVLEVGSGGPAVAEVAIDAVVYHLHGARVRHHEVEIEAKAPRVETAVRDITAALLERFGPSLRRGLQSKLAIGLAVHELHRQGRLAPLLAADGTLRPAAYDWMETVLTIDNIHP